MSKWEYPHFNEQWWAISNQIHSLMKEHGMWDNEPHIACKIAHLQSEASEAFECARYGKTPDKNIGHMSGIEVQLSDALGLLMDMSVVYTLDIPTALMNKMAYNETRGWRHGGKMF